MSCPHSGDRSPKTPRRQSERTPMRPDIKSASPRTEAAEESRTEGLPLHLAFATPLREKSSLRSQNIFFTEKAVRSDPTVANQRSSGDPEVIQSELDVSSSEPDPILSEPWLTSTEPNHPRRRLNIPLVLLESLCASVSLLHACQIHCGSPRSALAKKKHFFAKNSARKSQPPESALFPKCTRSARKCTDGVRRFTNSGRWSSTRAQKWTPENFRFNLEHQPIIHF